MLTVSIEDQVEDQRTVQLREMCLLETERYLANISYQSNMLLTLINDLLDLAKFETLNFTFNDDFFDLKGLIDKAYDTVKYQAGLKNINI